jgi:hypothetical protein
MVSGIYDSKGKPIKTTFPTIENRMYDTVIGSLDVASKAGAPATGGKGVLENRVGQSTFIGTISVKDNGGTEKVRMGKIGVGEWGLTVYDGNLIGGTIEIGDGDDSFFADETGIWAGDEDFDDAPFSVDMQGNLIATSGTIGDFTIESDRLYGGTLSTARTVSAGSTGVIMDTAGLRGYDSVLGKTFDLPTDGSAPEFSSGIIKETIFELQTSSIIRTSETVGDGTSDSDGVLMNDTGIYACTTNQSLANANVKILASGEATFSGSVKGGMTDFMTGTGYFLGESGGVYKFSIGDPSGNHLSWDDEYLRVKGNIELTSPLTNIGYAFASLPIPPTTVGFNSPSSNS